MIKTFFAVLAAILVAAVIITMVVQFFAAQEWLRKTKADTARMKAETAVMEAKNKATEAEIEKLNENWPRRN